MPWFGKLVALLATLTFVALGIAAIATKDITLGGRLGLKSFSGVGAEAVGFILLFFAGVFARALYRYGRYWKLIDAGLLIAWTLAALVYFLA